MHVGNNSEFSSSLRTNDFAVRTFGRSISETREETVPQRRLDEFLEEAVPGIAGRRGFLKLDTQGYDFEVFSGAEGILPGMRMLQSEVSLMSIYEGMPHWTDAISAYERAGFGVVGMFPVASVGRRIIEYDCLMVRGGA